LEIEGIVKNIVHDDMRHVYNLTLDVNGRNLSVGGYGATLEDVEAQLIEIVVLISPSI